MSNCTYCTLFSAVDYEANKRNNHCNLKQTVSQSYFLWKLVINVFSFPLSARAVNTHTHTSLCSLSKGDGRAEGFFTLTFPPTIQSQKAAVCSVRWEDPSLSGQQKRPQKVSVKGTVWWGDILYVNQAQNISWTFFFPWWNETEMILWSWRDHGKRKWFLYQLQGRLSPLWHHSEH